MVAAVKLEFPREALLDHPLFFLLSLPLVAVVAVVVLAGLVRVPVVLEDLAVVVASWEPPLPPLAALEILQQPQCHKEIMAERQHQRECQIMQLLVAEVLAQLVDLEMEQQLVATAAQAQHPLLPALL